MFWGKVFYLESFGKNRFLSINPQISTEVVLFGNKAENINILRRDVFLDHFSKSFFCPYIRIYQHKDEKEVLWFKKWFFVYISLNINISRLSTFFEIILKKSFMSISPKISMFKENHFFCNHFGKIVFSPWICKYQYLAENYVILRSLWNSGFLPTYPRHFATLREKGRFLGSLFKIVFCP